MSKQLVVLQTQLDELQRTEEVLVKPVRPIVVPKTSASEKLAAAAKSAEEQKQAALFPGLDLPDAHAALSFLIGADAKAAEEEKEKERQKEKQKQKEKEKGKRLSTQDTATLTSANFRETRRLSDALQHSSIQTEFKPVTPTPTSTPPQTPKAKPHTLAVNNDDDNSTNSINKADYSAHKVSTVWDEDDVEQLRIAHALAKHASALFPNNFELKQKERLAEESLARVVERRQSAALSMSSGEFESDNTSNKNNIKSLIGSWEQKQQRRISAARPRLIDPTVAARRLSIRQNAMLKKALSSMRTSDSDMTKPEQFASIASSILNEKDEETDEISTSPTVTESFNADLDDVLINSFFSGGPPPPIPSLETKPTSSNSRSINVPLKSSSSLASSSLAIKAPFHKPFSDIHERFMPSPLDAESSPLYEHPSGGPHPPRDRRQTMKHISSIQKRASMMPASRLIRELDSIIPDYNRISDMAAHDNADYDNNDDDDGDDDDDFDLDIGIDADYGPKSRRQWGTEGTANGWYNDEIEIDPELTTQVGKKPHPAHLVRYLDRSSLYTATEINTIEHNEMLQSFREDDEDNFDDQDFTAITQIPRFEFSGSRMETSGLKIETDLQTTPTTDQTVYPKKNKRNGVSLLPSPPGSAVSIESTASDKPHISVQEGVKRTKTTAIQHSAAPLPERPLPERPQSPSFFQRVFRANTTQRTVGPRGISEDHVRQEVPMPSERSTSSPSVLAAQTNTIQPSVSVYQSKSPFSPSYNQSASNNAYISTISRTVTTTNPTPHHHSNFAHGSSSLLNSEDDPDAISGELKLHTNKMFNAWQDIVLVMSPRKRGLYYVKIGKGFHKTEQVVGFIELNSQTVVEAIGRDDRGVANVFKGKPTFRVVKVRELSGGALKKEYFYFWAKENGDRDMWVDSMQSFVETLRQLDAAGNIGQSSSIYMGVQSIHGATSTPSTLYATASGAASLKTPEDISIQLLKQQKLLLQQRALLAAVAQQLQLQQEITAELQAAQVNASLLPHKISVTDVINSNQHAFQGNSIDITDALQSLAINNSSGSQVSSSNSQTLRLYPEIPSFERERKGSKTSRGSESEEINTNGDGSGNNDMYLAAPKASMRSKKYNEGVVIGQTLSNERSVVGSSVLGDGGSGGYFSTSMYNVHVSKSLGLSRPSSPALATVGVTLQQRVTSPMGNEAASKNGGMLSSSPERKKIFPSLFGSRK
ncbi:hypothetical protein HK100_005940 [Physocladia obscura]|uniref:PH domain-containing protein n=1 Tax=Physocladia obscura TaxID=109957 RepID=A0AAD5XKH9_9FUNG|nr:hypothetical protein HK100_005940 [Physocladia obscura]